MIGTRAVLFVALLLRVARRSVFRAVQCFALFNVPCYSTLRGVQQSAAFNISRRSTFRGVQHFAAFNIPRCSALRGLAVTRAANSPILKHFVGLLGNFLLIRVGLCFGAHGCVARLAEC